VRHAGDKVQLWLMLQVSQLARIVSRSKVERCSRCRMRRQLSDERDECEVNTEKQLKRLRVRPLSVGVSSWGHPPTDELQQELGGQAPQRDAQCERRRYEHNGEHELRHVKILLPEAGVHTF
jgi:hypothetical protein